MVNWSDETTVERESRLKREFLDKFPNLGKILMKKDSLFRVNISFPNARRCQATLYRILDLDQDPSNIVLSVSGSTIIEVLELVELALADNPSLIEEK